ncbi:hypothetical protein ACRN9O_13930 [Shewanella oncorhynchi]|uniref:hypothetical protein n=1 Tax=Shewanella oncorhynchi TaxID=2726434 RepID=UPI003D7A3564
MQLTKDDLTQADHDTILAYFAATQRAAGYNGTCLVCVSRLAELYLSNAINKSNKAIYKMMVKA